MPTKRTRGPAPAPEAQSEPADNYLIERVQQTEHRLRTIIDTEAACVKLVSADGVLLEMNRAGLTIIEADDSSQVVGQKVVDLIHPDDRVKFLRAHELAAAGQSATAEFRMIGLKGTQRWLEMHAVPFERCASSDASSPVLSVTNDVTERKALEEQLRQSQKLEAVGRLAGGIAHDFNNLVTAILGFCQLAIDKIPLEHDAHEDLVQVRDSAERAVGLIQQLLAFSRKQMLNPLVLDLNYVVMRLLTVLPRLIGEDIRISVELDPQLLRVRADPTQMDQILMNLATNARDATPGGGTLHLKTANIELTSCPVPGVKDFEPGSYVALTVTDSGTGMSQETADQIFEPFFTTKGTGCGTGLGLSTVYGIVKQSGGYITVDSEPGHGSAFAIYLPATTEAVDVLPASEPEAVHSGIGTILLVEDAAPVREFVRRTLEMSGYHVLAARDAQDAIDITTAAEERIDLLLTDVVMPGLTGPQLVAQIKRTRPLLRALYMTGYSDRHVLGKEDDGVMVLNKPFSASQLLSAIQDTLAQVTDSIPQ